MIRRLEIDRRLGMAEDLLGVIRNCEDTLDQLLSVREVPLAVPSGFFRNSGSPKEPVSSSRPEDFPSLVGERIRECRERRGMTQADLASATGIKRPNIARLERGTGLPNVATLLRVATGLGIPIGSLLS